MNQSEFTSIFCTRPQNFAWFVGAGASRTAGLPTATDVIWDMKKRYYSREENQDISRQDIQNQAVRERIQSFMLSRGFPAEGEEGEYAVYFEKIFGDDKERQRKYLKAALSEDKVTLAVGNRVLGALLSSGLSRAAFTTNFDTVVERAVAEVSGTSLAAYHLEGSHAAAQALNNEEYPLYVKLHGDFRYDSLKNLPADLSTQNDDLARCMVNAGNRFGFVVAGYSGRDASIMALFRAVLAGQNPFPHGLFWTGMKGAAPPAPVAALLAQARSQGVTAHYVEIETFDALMLRLWRNIEPKSEDLDAKIRKSRITSVNIPLPAPGARDPLLRTNALPLLSVPAQCLSLSFASPKTADELRLARDTAKSRVILARSRTGLCWGDEKSVKDTYGADLLTVSAVDLPGDLSHPENLDLKGFVEEAICAALGKDKPLVCRNTRSGSFLIANPTAPTKDALAPLVAVVKSAGGNVPGVKTVATEQRPAEQVRWAESLRISLEIKNGQRWLLIEPDIWIWPQHARKDAATFMEKRRSDRYNKVHDALLGAWIRIILGTDKVNTSVTLRAFDEGSDAGNPAFMIGSRTAFSRRLAS